jgi:hypothetical protein
MAGLERVDLQREADEERTRVIRSEEDRDHLESFKRGEVDRWGARPASALRLRTSISNADSSRSPEGGGHRA